MNKFLDYNISLKQYYSAAKALRLSVIDSIQVYSFVKSHCREELQQESFPVESLSS